MRLVAIAAAGVLLTGAETQTTEDGVYSEAQAKRGEAIYAKMCASCHGAGLEGDAQAPALADKDFAAEWTGQPLGDLFERIRLTMPGDAPGTLKPADVADVLAFLLKKGGHSTGTAELPPDAAALKAVTFRRTS
jgi:mono/diheme cytochrome c family protein